MNFEALVKSTKKHRIVAEELSKFPEVKRDLALLVDKQVTFSALRDVAFATERKLLKSVSLFDVYEGDKLPEGKKSYALSFIPRRQDPHAGRKGHRTGHAEPHGAVRAPVRRPCPCMTRRDG